MDKMDEKLKFLTKFSYRGPLGMFVVLAGFAFLFLLMYKKVPAENKDVITFAAGQMLTLAGVVIGWYFGSSKQQADAQKTEQVKELLSDQPADQV